MVEYGPIVELTPDESHAEHPCTSVALYEPDRDLLGYMLQDLRSMMRSVRAGTMAVVPHDPIVWSVHGYLRRTVICDPDGLGERNDVCVVGFFGERRSGVDFQPLDESERELLGEFRGYPGILSYSSIELADDHWANLVIHRAPDDRQRWRESESHVRAVAVVAPRSYQSVRIHNGRLSGGVVGSDSIVLERTKYWDYGCTPVWRGLRNLGPGR